MADDDVLGEFQFEFRERICAAWPRESFLEIIGKLEFVAANADDGILQGLVAALIASVDLLAAEVDKINGRV